MNAPLPPQVLKIAALIGLDLAMVLVEHAHGIDGTGFVYVPRYPKAGQCMVSLIGRHATETMTTAYGGRTIQLPMCRSIFRAERNSKLRNMASAGATVPAIAQAFHLSNRHVRNLLCYPSKPRNSM